jgi:flagellar basal body-associated protein FliL
MIIIIILFFIFLHCAGGATYSTIKNHEKERTEKKQINTYL